MVGELFRRAVGEAAIKDGELSIQVAISIGGTPYPEPANGRKPILKGESGSVLAKESGRNQGVVMI